MTPQADIAIVGMSCIYPGAPNVQAFWDNILRKHDAVTDPPAQWHADDFYDPNTADENDKIYCKKGGFIGGYADFSPLEFGIMPSSIDGSDPEHYLALRVAKEALTDAGCFAGPFPNRKTAVILGHGNYFTPGHVNVLQHALMVRQVTGILKKVIPDVDDATLEAVRAELKGNLKPFTAETCPGLVSNIITGRIANRFDLQGPNYAIDAACASSLLALEAGMRELREGTSDMALVGGVQGHTNVLIFIVFSLLGALSRRGRIRPFDKDADGTLLGEGVGMMVIKRREDAERDGDRIYALVNGVGVSSDGKAQAMLVPRLEGEALAIKRAYELAGVDPMTVGLVEAHGTATKVGDRTEIQSLASVFGRANDHRRLPLGSVKSMISHTIPAAGMASLIKCGLALHHKVLPPTLCDEPNPDLGIADTPFYLNTETRPWIHGYEHPRRVGVSAFGFGGINTHAVLEEYRGAVTAEGYDIPTAQWPAELFVIQGKDRRELIAGAERLISRAAEPADSPLVDLAAAVNRDMSPGNGHRLAVVAASVTDLTDKLRRAVERLRDADCRAIHDRDGIYFFDRHLDGKIAFLFPGEGSQYPGMLGDLCMHFPAVRAWFDRADRVFTARGRRPLPSEVVYPEPDLDGDTREQRQRTLMSIEYAVASMFAADMAMRDVLAMVGIRADVMAGHSIGQDIALHAAGAVNADTPDTTLEAYLRNHVIQNRDILAAIPEARLMAVGAAPEGLVAELVAQNGGELYIAMDNCPNQTVLCGPEEPIRQAMTTLTARGAICTFLPFSRGYHSPLYQPVCDYLREPARRVPVKTPATAIYSCSTARPFPADPEEIRTLAIDQYARTVRFRETVEGLYEEGVRLFIEVGPRGNLCSFVHDTLGKREHEAVAMDLATEHGITRLNRSLGLLAAHGVALNLDPVYQNRQSSRKTASATASKLPSLRLDMSLPRLKLSDDTAATVRAQAASARSASTPATPDRNGGFSDTTTDRANRVPRMSARPGTDHKSSVVNAYLHTMEEMVGAEGSIMGAFVDAHRKGTGAGTGLADLPAIIRAGVDPLSPSIHSDHRLRFALCIENGPVDHDAWSRAVAPSEKSRAQSSMTATPGELTSMKDAAYLLWRDVYGCRIGHGECVVESYQSSRAVVRTHGGERAARVAVTRVGPLALAVARDGAGGEEGIGLHAQVDSAAVPGEPLLSDTERRMVTTAATMDSQSPWLAIAGMMKRAAMAALGRPTTHGLFLRSLDPGSGSATIHYESGGERVTLTAFAGRIETILCALAVY